MTATGTRGAPLLLPGFRNRVGHHCSSSALVSVLAYDGVELSEAMAFGLGSGLGFFYVHEPDSSPSRRFNGRAPDLEGNFYRLLGRPLPWAGRWQPELILNALRAGRPVLAQTDIHPIPYYDDAHFYAHGIVVVGLAFEDLEGAALERREPEQLRDDDLLLIADIAAPDFSRMSVRAFREAVAVAHDPLMTPYHYAPAPRVEQVPVAELAPRAIAQTCNYLLEPPSPHEGLAGMARLADELPGWSDLADAGWAARFGYQAIEKRGTGGGGFRYLYADFLDEAAAHHPLLAEVAPRFRDAARQWQEVAAALKDAAFAERAPQQQAFVRATAALRRVMAIEQEALERLAEVVAKLP